MRRPGKTLILLLLVFILGTVISGAIAVDGAINNTEANLRRNMRPLVTFQLDWQTYDEFIDELGISWIEADEQYPIDDLTPSIVREIGALEYVEYFKYSIPVWIETDSLQDFRFEFEDEMYQELGMESQLAYLEFRGTSATELLQVREGVLEVVEGRGEFTEAELTTLSDVHPIIVSSGFANTNNLTVGSTFELPVTVNLLPDEAEMGEMWDWEAWELSDESTFAEEVFAFEVIGLVDSVEEVDPDDFTNWEVRNRIEMVLRTLHIPNITAEAIQQFIVVSWAEMLLETEGEIDIWAQRDLDREEAYVSSVMVLRDALDLDEFRIAASRLLPEFWEVTDLSNSFDDISSSMETLQSIAGWILWVSVGATLLILSLLITLFLRDRRYEMGVYLALGERKGRITSQILLEVVVTSLIGITLALFTGSIISGVMSRNMLTNELAAREEQPDYFFHSNEFTHLGLEQEMSAAEMMDAFDVSPSIQTIALFYALGLGAVILSTVVPVIYVVTLNPKKVLM